MSLNRQGDFAILAYNNKMITLQNQANCAGSTECFEVGAESLQKKKGYRKKLWQ